MYGHFWLMIRHEGTQTWWMRSLQWLNDCATIDETGTNRKEKGLCINRENCINRVGFLPWSNIWIAIVQKNSSKAENNHDHIKHLYVLQTYCKIKQRVRFWTNVPQLMFINNEQLFLQHPSPHPNKKNKKTRKHYVSFTETKKEKKSPVKNESLSACVIAKR